MPDTVRLPTRFLEDHASRGCDTPAVLRRTAEHVYVRVDDPAIPELLDDAEYFVSEGRYMDRGLLGLVASARATAHAILTARGRALFPHDW